MCEIYLVVTQCPYDRFVQQEFYIFCVVQNFDVASTALGTSTMLRFARIDTFDDAQTPEIVQR